MEQIIVTKPDGSKYPLAIRRTATTITQAKQNWALLADDTVSISLESPFPQKYGIGDWILVFGRVYKLNRLPQATKGGVHAFSYKLEFEGVQYDLMRAAYNLTIDTTDNELQDVQADTLTGDLNRFATVLISNANRVFGVGVWKLGTCPSTIEDKTLTFGEADNCLSVLQTLCTEFKVEFEISQADGVFTINFVEKVGQTFPFTFKFGRGGGLYELTRQNVDSSNIVTRLHVFGSSSNITNKYRASRLCLPGKSKAQSYIETADAVAKYGIYEATKYFDDIKPTFDGSITNLVDGDILKFVDTKMFDLNAKEADGVTTKYLIAGCAAKIHFNTGNLAGYQFEVHTYDHATHTFTLVKQTDDRGDTFPSESSTAFQFAQGDVYKLLDVALPDSPYQNDAEAKLLEQGTVYYNQNSQPKVQYGLDISKDFLKKMTTSETIVNIFVPGDYIPIEDEDIDVKKSVRVKSLTRNLLDVYDYKLTISDTVTTSIVNRVISELIDHDKTITINNLKDPARAKANWRSSREVLGMVFDPEGDYYTEKIKPNSIDTNLLSVGAKSMQFGLTNTVFQPNFNGQKNAISVKGGVLTHYTINEERAVSWMLSDNVTTFDADSKAYYIYAKCERNGDNGVIIFTTEQIQATQSGTHYHFWIGIVNSVDPELHARSISLSYGFTMINGRFIKTGRIESADGETYFDLDNSEIGGRIVFSSNGEEKTLEELGEESLESKDFINNTLPGILDEIQAQLDGQIEQFFDTYDPTNGNAPANEWTTTALKEAHLGDLFYNTDNGKVFRWIKKSTSYEWQQLKDDEVAQALAIANDALALAREKRRIFTDTPYTPYDIGDLWVQGGNGDIMRCKVTRISGSYTTSDWEKASNYTSDAALESFINDTYNGAITDLTTQIDGKIETWFQESNPWNSWAGGTGHKHVGDMWYNPTTHELKRFAGSDNSNTWVDIVDKKALEAYEVASNAKDTADGKRRVFVATPYAPYDIGDLWADGKELRRCATAKASGQAYNVLDWVTCVEYDNTKTVIDGGLVTSGTIQVAGDNKSILAGITGQGTTASSIRFWAGASFENRAVAPYRVLQDGSVVMTKATITGIINALSGTIGGFEIGQGRIGVENNDSYQGLSLLNSLIKFSDERSWTGIGTNVYPSSSGMKCLARHELNCENSSYSSGVALYTKARFPNDGIESWYIRRSLWNDGNMFSIGGHSFFYDGYIGRAGTDVIEVLFKNTHKFHFLSCTTTYLAVNLPTKTMVSNAVGSSRTVMFNIEIVCDKSMGNKIRVMSQTDAQIYDNTGNSITGIDLTKGDSLTLRYYNGTYHVINSKY